MLSCCVCIGVFEWYCAHPYPDVTTRAFPTRRSSDLICGVRRSGADGRWLRGAAGDFKTPTAFRLHLGSEDQAPDPGMFAAIGFGATPAHRGAAYAVFEQFELAEYGNRIPSLTFEKLGSASWRERAGPYV